MSLGFPSVNPFGAPRHEPLSAPPKQAEPPMRLRIEAIEIALGRLSQMVQDLAADLEATLEGGDDNDNIITGGGGIDAVAARLSDVEEEVQGIHDMTSRLNDIETASGFSAMHVHATVVRSTKMYTNKTGDFKKDVKPSNGPIVLIPGTHIRLIFPQEELPDGRICMGGVCVDEESMALTTGWVVVADMKRKFHFVSSFAV